MGELVTTLVKVIEKPYDDLLQPTLQEIGLWMAQPIMRARRNSEAKNKHLQQELICGCSEIKPDNLVEPPLEVVGPALESLKYVEDEALQDMDHQL